MSYAGRLMIAGTGSGCGKTTVVCGILRGLQKRKETLFAWKSGPDYIDPLFHERVLGIPGGNLDGFFCDETLQRGLMAEEEKSGSLQLVEGAMGFYDGIGITARASSYALAAATKTPVVLVVDGKGMANSLLAVIQGFLDYAKPSGIKGVIINRISKGLYEQLKDPIRRLGVLPLGYVPVLKEFTLSSRHLGLVMAGEIPAFGEKLEDFAEQIRETIDWESLLGVAGCAPSLCLPNKEVPTPLRDDGRFAGVKLAVARDEAFCFLYADNLRYLERKGVKLHFFSPVHDHELPEGMDAFWLPGGYPELHARQLSGNLPMRESIRVAISHGMPYLAECGGFLYLMEQIQAEDGTLYPLTGIYPGCGKKKSLGNRFGYVEGSADDLLYGKRGLTIKAHEFHYYSNEEPGTLFSLEKASGTGSWRTGYGDENSYAGFPHIYFYGNVSFAEAFLERAKAWHEKHHLE